MTLHIPIPMYIPGNLYKEAYSNIDRSKENYKICSSNPQEGMKRKQRNKKQKEQKKNPKKRQTKALTYQ